MCVCGVCVATTQSKEETTAKVFAAIVPTLFAHTLKFEPDDFLIFEREREREREREMTDESDTKTSQQTMIQGGRNLKMPEKPNHLKKDNSSYSRKRALDEG